MFGGNSNWRGPIWFPVNYLLVTSLRRFAEYYGDEFKIECPTGSGNMLSIHAVADELALRLTRLFRRDGQDSGQYSAIKPSFRKTALPRLHFIL